MVYPNWRDLRVECGEDCTQGSRAAQAAQVQVGKRKPHSWEWRRSLVSAGLGEPELAGEDTGGAWADCRASRVPGAEAHDVSPVVCVEVNYGSKIRRPVV